MATLQELEQKAAKLHKEWISAMEAVNAAMDATRTPAIIRAWGGWEAAFSKISKLQDERKAAFDAWQDAEDELRPVREAAIQQMLDLRRREEQDARFMANAMVAE